VGTAFPVRKSDGLRDTAASQGIPADDKLSLTIRLVYNLLQPFIRHPLVMGNRRLGTAGKGHSVKITVSKIPEGGMSFQAKKDEKWFRAFLPDAEPGDFTLETIDVVCSVRRMKETVFIEGNVATSVAAPCCRCLEMTRLPVSAAFRYTFCPPPADPQEEWELTAEDLDFAYYEEDTIDLDMLIFEQIMLQIPVKPLCGESCRGLCPHCGINLNTASCHCRAEAFDERLTVLKKFKVQPEKP
jgi:uncharacterized protein